ncbi:MAG: LPS export ABC transporter permease LptF [Rhodospirillaceae bacterium]|nr:LPS export ABC transporter permease LptF [Rhodospirillaceae bacterium]
MKYGKLIYRGTNLTVQINGYITKQLVLAFIAVVLSLTCVVWLSQSLRFIDLIVNRGLPLPTFIYLTILLLPTWLSIVMPIAIFASSLYIYNRMLVDREIVILIASGLSPLRLSFPTILVSTVVMIACYVMTLYLIPVSYREFKELQFKIRHSYTDVILREGTFNAIDKNITVYVGERSSDGELSGIIVNDDRNSLHSITLIAETGALLVTEKGPKVFMRNGNRQSRNTKTGEIGLLYFDSYTVDLGGITSITQRSWRDQNELFLFELLNPSHVSRDSRSYKKHLAEGHHRLTSPILALALPLIGLAILLRGEFSRRGQTSRILIAVFLAGLVECICLGSKFFAAHDLLLVPLMYAAILIPLSAATMGLSARPLSLLKIAPSTNNHVN